MTSVDERSAPLIAPVHPAANAIAAAMIRRGMCLRCGIRSLLVLLSRNGDLPIDAVVLVSFGRARRSKVFTTASRGAGSNRGHARGTTLRDGHSARRADSLPVHGVFSPSSR